MTDTERLIEIATKLDALESRLELLTRLIQGNGEPGKSLIVRVDRLEQAESQRRWWLRGLALSVVSLFAERLRQWL